MAIHDANEEPEEKAPDVKPGSREFGIVDGGEENVSDRPQGDPEIPELGAHDDERQGR